MGGFPSILDSALKGWLKNAPPLANLKSSNPFAEDYSSSASLLKMPPPASKPSENLNQAANLARLVEGEIIPRLMLAHNETANPGACRRPGSWRR